MNVKKYLKKMTDSLGLDRDRCRNRKACLELILKKLKKRKREIKILLSKEQSEEQLAILQQELSVIQAQRKKGLKALKAVDDEY